MLQPIKKIPTPDEILGENKIPTPEDILGDTLKKKRIYGIDFYFSREKFGIGTDGWFFGWSRL